MKRKRLILIIVILCFLGLSVLGYSSSQETIKEGSTIIEGDFILTDDNFEEAKNIEIVKGNFVVETTKIDKVSLDVEIIEGFLTMSEKVKSIHFGKLKEVGGLYITASFEPETKLENLELTCLERVEGDIEFTYNFDLRKINLPKLNKVTGNMTIKYNDNLKKINLPELEEVEGDVDITRNYLLEEIIFSNLKRIDDQIYIHFNTKINKVNLKKLEFSKGRITIGDTSLKELDLSSLINVKALSISNNNYLKKIHFNNLTKVNKFVYLQGNDILKEIIMPKINSIGEFNGSSITFEENGIENLILQVEKIPKYKGKIKGVEFKIIEKRGN